MALQELQFCEAHLDEENEGRALRLGQFVARDVAA